MKPIETLQEARDYVVANRPEGVHCPCCGQMARNYRRKLTSAMARALIWMVRSEGDVEGWVDIDQAPRWFFKSGGDYGKLVHWGLLEMHPTAVSKRGGRTAGKWRPTPLGVSFAHGRAAVASHVFIYDNHRIGVSNTSTTIVEALGDHFDFDELWNSRGVR